jgi:hypothetical protein
LTNLEAEQRRGREVVHVEELSHRNELVSVPDEEGNQTSSEAIKGDWRPTGALTGHQRSSEVIRGHQRSSEVIRGH